ncbi:MAG: twin-arginine translocase TatA/TatE family subunit [Nitrospirae bacterium]|nr:MAG: twin-arginine translocase TatA/TatE family subunit [Nitrospirota bacterium]
MFDIGLQELIVIFVVALIVFGPKRLPEIGKTIGKSFWELKKAMDGVKAQVHSEMHDIKDPIDLKNHLYGNDEKQPDGESSDLTADAKDTIGKDGASGVNPVKQEEKG